MAEPWTAGQGANYWDRMYENLGFYGPQEPRSPWDSPNYFGTGVNDYMTPFSQESGLPGGDMGGPEPPSVYDPPPQTNVDFRQWSRSSPHPEDIAALQQRDQQAASKMQRLYADQQAETRMRQQAAQSDAQMEQARRRAMAGGLYHQRGAQAPQTSEELRQLVEAAQQRR